MRNRPYQVLKWLTEKTRGGGGTLRVRVVGRTRHPNTLDDAQTISRHDDMTMATTTGASAEGARKMMCVDGNTFRRVLLARAAFRGVVFGGVLYLGATTLDRIKRLEDSNAAMALKLDTVNKEVVQH